jgi:predicted permease
VYRNRDTRTQHGTGLNGAMQSLLQDLRHALRLMGRQPAFTLAALATLTLGIGASTAIFSVAYGVLWRPLPYPEPDRLVIVSAAQQTSEGVRTFSTWAPRSFDALRSATATLEQLAAYTPADAYLTGLDEPRQVSTLEVSPNFFATLGVAPVLGRVFLVDAASSPDDRSVVISDRLWRSTFHADPAIVGQPIALDNAAYTVVGVLGSDFSFTPVVPRTGALDAADVFVASRWAADTGERAFLWLVGRMRPGSTEERVATELTALANAPGVVPVGTLASAGAVEPGGRLLATVTSLQNHNISNVRTLLLILLGAVSLVLLIACVNVANLQMARLTSRRAELSIRMALGAGRRRIARQLLTEAVVLSLIGALLGVALANVTVAFTLPLVPQGMLPRAGSIVIDARVLAFSLVLSIVATLVVGLVPAARLGGATFGEAQALHAGQVRVTSDRQGERARAALVAAQIAMTLLLLVGAGLLVHSFLRLTSAPTGFEANRRDGVVQTVRVTLPEYLYGDTASIHAFVQSVLRPVRHLPGVTSASVINSVPLGLFFIQDEFEVEGKSTPPFLAGVPRVEPNYFQTMGIPLLAGRDFTEADTSSGAPVVIVSEQAVRGLFPRGPQEAINQRLRIGESGPWMSIVGVVADVRQWGTSIDVQPMIYLPFRQDQSGFLRIMSFVVRTTEPAQVARDIRTEIRRVAPALPIDDTRTMEQAMSASVAQPRFRMVLLGLFAAAATLIATCGLYGVMAYAVTQRRREIGVRLACGATRADVIRLVLARALRIVVGGLVVGMAGAVASTRVLRTLLYGVEPTDPVVLVAVAVFILAVGLAAAWLPARRATSVDPWKVLRAE